MTPATANKAGEKRSTMSNLLAKKSMNSLMAEANEEGSQTLERSLGPFSLTALGIGAVIGAGIFVLSGLGAKTAGPALMLAFVLSGLGCAFAGLCYAEFAAMIPLAGSAYTYAYATLGEIFAWIIGWDLTLEYAMGASTVSSGWSNTFVEFLAIFHLKFPLWLAYDHWTGLKKGIRHRRAAVGPRDQSGPGSGNKGVQRCALCFARKSFDEPRCAGTCAAECTAYLRG